MHHLVFVVVLVLALGVSFSAHTHGISIIGRNDSHGYLSQQAAEYFYNCSDDPQNVTKKTGEKKYILIHHFPEQLSKARIHLSEAMALAKLANRVLVLPRVGGGYMGNEMQHTLNLCSHFDSWQIGRFVDVESPDRFFEEIQWRNGSSVDIFSLFLHKRTTKCSEVQSSLLYLPSFPPNSHSGSPQQQRQPQLNIYGRKKKTSFLCSMCRSGNECVQVWKSVRRRREKVVVVHKSTAVDCLRNKLSKSALSFIQYSNPLHRHVNKFIAQRLGPKFIAVHWRTEKSFLNHLEDARVASCAEGIVRSVKKKMAALGSAKVFVAIDVGQPGRSSLKSDSMKQTFAGYPQQLKLYYNARKRIFDELQPMTWEAFDPDYAYLDPGIQGILEKLTCMKAAHFFYVPWICAGTNLSSSTVTSSYTSEIISSRVNARIPTKANSQWDV